MFTIKWKAVHVAVESVFTIPWKQCSPSRGIRMKLQGFVNNPRRTQDLEDSGQPFAADGGITHVPAATSRDPFEALDDLMTVIEALCPVWPSREIFSSTDRFLI